MLAMLGILVLCFTYLDPIWASFVVVGAAFMMLLHIGRT
jgi:hypothetical protein